jgi:hypothetical protein
MFSGGADHFKINSSGVLEFGGANAPGWTNNLGLTYASSTLTITDAQGAALSTTNPGWVTVPSTTAGTVVPMEVTAAWSGSNGNYFIDDGGASDIVGEEFGVTTSVAWANPRPFFLYACMQDADAGVAFAISPNPCASVVPATANIGYHANPAATPSDNNFFFLCEADPTTAFDTNPCVKIGAINMVMSASDDWTVQALATVPSGIGQHFIDAHHAKAWTMPSGQNGATADAGSGGYYYINATSGTPQYWATPANVRYVYTIDQSGYVHVDYNTAIAGNCAAGSAASTNALVLPYMQVSGPTAAPYVPAGIVKTKTVNRNLVFSISITSPIATFTDTAVTTNVQCNDYDDTGDDVRASFRYKAF